MRRAVTPIVLLLVWLFSSITLAGPPPIPSSPKTHVSDEVGVLSPAVEQSLAERLARYEARTGHQIVVWVGSTSGDRAIEEFAVEAFEHWKVGRKGLDDGLALFVFVEDRKARIEVGYGLEDRVTDLIAGKIIRDVIAPRAAAGDFDGAVVGGAEAIVAALGGTLDGGGTGNRGPPEVAIPDWIQIAVGLVLLVGFLILLFTNPRLALMLLFMLGRGGGGGGGRHDRGGGFSGRGGRSGGGGATGGW